MYRYLQELLGTFFFVLTIGLTTGNIFAPLAVSGMLIALLYAGGHISGAHYNPAVTLGVWLRGSLPMKEVLPYMGAQCLGALGAAFAVLYLEEPFETVDVAMVPSLLVEFLFTFLLVYVVLCVATTNETKGNSFFGLAIGLTVLAGAFAVGDISSAVFNPAVALGLMAMKLASWSDLWLYLLAQFAGGIVAAGFFRVTHCDTQS